MKTFFNEHLTEIITGITGVMAWLFERRKRKLSERIQIAKVKDEETSSNSKIIDLYKEALDDLEQRYDKRFEVLDKELDLFRRNQELWKKKYRDLKKEYQDLKNEFDEYKKNHNDN